MFNRKIKLTASTCENDIFINDKPTYNKSGSIDWIRNLKPTYKEFSETQGGYEYEIPTAKLCPGIQNYVNRGIKQTFWMNLTVRILPNGDVIELHGINPRSNDGAEPFGQHDRRQYEHLYQRNKTAFKITAPWMFQCNEKIDFLITESHYSTHFWRENNLLLSPAIIDYKYQHSTNVHVIADIKKEPYDITIPYGTPLVTYYPLTDREIDLECKLVSREKFNNIQSHFPRCPMAKYAQHIKNLTRKD